MEDTNAAVYITIVCCALLSLVGSFSILVIYFSFKNLQAFPYTLVCWLGFSDLITASSLLMPAAHDSTRSFCTLQATLISFSSLASILLTSAIAHALYSILIKNVSLGVARKRLPLYFGYVAGIALLGAVVPLAYGSYTPAGAWCWIRPQKHYAMALGAFYIPMMLVFVYNIFVVFSISRAMRFELNDSRRRVVCKILMYPLVMAICIGPLTVLRIVEIINGHETLQWLSNYAAIQYSLFGFFNFLVYGLTVNVRKTLRTWLTGKEEAEHLEDESLLIESGAPSEALEE